MFLIIQYVRHLNSLVFVKNAITSVSSADWCCQAVFSSHVMIHSHNVSHGRRHVCGTGTPLDAVLIFHLCFRSLSGRVTAAATSLLWFQLFVHLQTSLFVLLMIGCMQRCGAGGGRESASRFFGMTLWIIFNLLDMIIFSLRVV